MGDILPFVFLLALACVCVGIVSYQSGAAKAREECTDDYVKRLYARDRELDEAVKRSHRLGRQHERGLMREAFERYMTNGVD